MQLIPEPVEARLAQLLQHSTLPGQELVPHLLQQLQAGFLPGENLLAGTGSSRAACRVLSCLPPQHFGAPGAASCSPAWLA